MFTEQQVGNSISHFISLAPPLSATKLPPFFSESEYWLVIPPRVLEGLGKLSP
jgi:hypothetical protein